MPAYVGNNGIFVGSPEAWEAVCKCASGRRQYNAIRHVQMIARRRNVMRLWLAYSELGAAHGVQARIARDLGVSRPTVSKDLKAMLQLAPAC